MVDKMREKKVEKQGETNRKEKQEREKAKEVEEKGEGKKVPEEGGKGTQVSNHFYVAWSPPKNTTAAQASILQLTAANRSTHQIHGQ